MQNWRHNPQFKIEISGETFTNSESLTFQVTRPENSVGFLVLTVDDYKSKNFVDVFDALDAIDVSLRYGSDSWTKVFSGVLSTPRPRISPEGEVLDVAAWGNGNATVKTKCDESYGVESMNNNAVNTPKEIIDDLITNHINKVFGGAASNWSVGNKVDDIHNDLSVTFLNSQYDDNFTVINRLMDLVSAHSVAASDISAHWFVDPTPNLYVKEIDADHSDGNWDRYWGGMAGADPGTQASSTIVVKEDMILYDFRKTVEEYANHIVLASKWRMPSEDYWTENQSALWGETDATLTDSATAIVGSKSLLIENSHAANPAYAYYPSGQNLGLDLQYCGSEHTIPHIGFWARKNKALGANAHIRLCSSAGNEWATYSGLDSHIPQNDTWTYVDFPIGPYFGRVTTTLQDSWQIGVGAPSWNDIDYIQFMIPGGDQTIDLFIDDLHFSGAIVREAWDVSEVVANKYYTKFIRNDVAVNDSLVAATDTGTAAQLAYAELVRRIQTPLVGMFWTPLAVDALPGQTVHIHACQKSDGTYRVDKDMRVKELKHVVELPYPKTIWNVTDDVTNSHAFAAPTVYGLLMEYAGALGQAEARDLKGAGIDNLIPRLSKSYA